MAQTIHRLFESNERANQAAEALRTDRILRFEDVFVFSGLGPTGAARSTDEIVADMMKACVLKADAQVLAAGIQRGGTLVTVHAAFGTAVMAINLLEEHGPIDSGLVEFKEPVLLWDEAAPLSSALRLPPLLADSATFSRFWNVPPLVRSGGTTSAALGLPELSRASGPFSGTFPMALLSNNPAPLSKLLGLPLLTSGRTTKF